jgi:gamma-glutamylcyclotransferase (GGCT)/AIG2-like uncharacterized protein YtfP
MKLKDFLQQQAKKAGYQVPDGILDNAPDYEVSEELTKGLDNGLISLADAKNNHPEIRNHYRTEALDTADKTLANVLKKYPELAEDEDIKGERSTYKRIELIANKIDELVTKKSGSKPAEKVEIQKQIDDLHAQLKAANDARTADKTAHEQAFKDFKKKSGLIQKLSSFKTIHDELPGEVRATILETLINKELQDNDADLDFDDAGKWNLRKRDGSNFYGENHTQIGADDFIEKTLAKHKQLKVSNGHQNGANQQQQTTKVDADNKQSSVISANQKALEAYKQGTALNAQIMG